MTAFRILIADDHEVVRRGIRSLLEKHAGWQVIGEARDGLEAVHLCKKLHPDLVLLDVDMPRLNGIDAARQIRTHDPQMHVIMVADEDSEQTVHDGVAAGARGFLLKTGAVRDVAPAVEALQHGRVFFSAKIAEFIIRGFLSANGEPEPLGNHLTPREREVAQLLAEGKKTREVADVLQVSVKTAETHRANVMRKLELRSMADLTVYAIRNRMIRVFH